MTSDPASSPDVSEPKQETAGEGILRLNPGVTELRLQLPATAMSALDEIAERHTLTVGQLVRFVLANEIGSPARVQ